ncbi:putative kinesin-like protein KIFC3 [Apostichopus japonicus]|uniref:Putative kinesin-like protein KIFC3 n=1 Tax=Stichopus japonicus TaxID=307972 RepID=A0A2G8JC82_STIJA|nr:putative kinesin-like protein KIFC3 [Apostichopus japonicus]
MSRRSPRNVFNTPKTYQPSRSSSRPSPTPSRTEVLLEELGIETDDLGIQQLESSSGSEGEDSEDGDHLQAEGLSSDAKVLHRELSQVKIERDELLLRVKTLREKSDHYQQLANKEKTSKSQQIKILRKTHENQLSAKSQLMQNLHDIIEEQEGKIFELEAQLQGNYSGLTSKFLRFKSHGSNENVMEVMLKVSNPRDPPSTLSERVRSLSDSLDKLQAQMALMKEKQMVEGTSSKQEQNKENTTPGTINNSQMASYLTEINHLKKKLEDSNKTNQKLQEDR